MLIKVKRGWEMRESEATPESVFLNRRTLVKAMGVGTILAGAGLPLGNVFAADKADDMPDPSASLYPAKRNDKYTLDRADHRREILDQLQQLSTNTARTRTSRTTRNSSRCGRGRSRSTAWSRSRSPWASTIC